MVKVLSDKMQDFRKKKIKTRNQCKYYNWKTKANITKQDGFI